MNNVQIHECKFCGAELNLRKAIENVVVCGSCKRVHTLPKKEASPAALSFLRQGEHDLDTCKFDDAYSAFAKAAEYDKEEPEAYWGMALAEFKVQYIKDTVKTNDFPQGHLQPICHEFTDKQFTQNRNYLSALRNATQSQKEEYEKKAQEIDYIRSEFLKLQQSGLDYDCFICVKVSRIDSEQTDNSKKNWTEDAYDADAIYDLLKRNGYTPFFSEREIRGRTGADYEAMILYALYTSETMLVVCRNEEYLQTPWVKNEYTRFKELVNNREKENDALTIVYNGTPIERLPGSNGKIQGIDYSRRQADFEIVKFVENHTPIARAKREEEKRKKDSEAELIRRQIEEQKKAQRELEERLKNLNPNTAVGTSSTVETLLTRANQEMEAKNFDKASKILETVLERAPENAAAWWGKFLCEFNVTNEDAILFNLEKNIIEKIKQSENYKYALKYCENEIEIKTNEFVKKAQHALLPKIKEIENHLNISNNNQTFDANEFQNLSASVRQRLKEKEIELADIVKKLNIARCNLLAERHLTGYTGILSGCFSLCSIFWLVFMIIMASTGIWSDMPNWLKWGYFGQALFIPGYILEPIAYGIPSSIVLFLIVITIKLRKNISHNKKKYYYDIEYEKINQEKQEIEREYEKEKSYLNDMILYSIFYC